MNAFNNIIIHIPYLGYLQCINIYRPIKHIIHIFILILLHAQNTVHLRFSMQVYKNEYTFYLGIIMITVAMHSYMYMHEY